MCELRPLSTVEHMFLELTDMHHLDFAFSIRVHAPLDVTVDHAALVQAMQVAALRAPVLGVGIRDDGSHPVFTLLPRDLMMRQCARHVSILPRDADDDDARGALMTWLEEGRRQAVLGRHDGADLLWHVALTDRRTAGDEGVFELAIRFHHALLDGSLLLLIK